MLRHGARHLAVVGVLAISAVAASPGASPNTSDGLGAARPNSQLKAPERWYPPLGSPLIVSSSYSLPNGPYRAGHRGIDLPAAVTQTVYAPVSGTVTFAGTVVDRPVISIRVDSHTVVSLEPVTSELQEGSAVTRAARIGVVVTGGHCTASCLHLGVRIDGNYTNPLRFFRSRAILLPWSSGDAGP